ncbi:hypothetical protein [Faucicola atlantae]|uniref:Uncharacterized protein n=1 Tax=Faucicola atlantae TaxID=34059 RepID=A0A1B8QCV2_9GAMM|nr:hypothetical protein [Moraxella atlantae]OBX79127.1 hypothetical protein A9306_08935 [Moraxella atlantae]
MTNELLNQHLSWLITNLPIIYGAVAGAMLRLLLIRNEPILARCQNALSGIVFALVFAPLAADYLSHGKFSVGYAMAFGLVCRELILPALNVLNDRIVPLFNHYIDKLVPTADDDRHKQVDNKEQENSSDAH